MTPSPFILGLILVAGCPAGVSEEGRAHRPVDHQAMELEVHRLVNQERTARGRPALSHDEAIAAIAREHSVNMARGVAAFGHDGFAARVEKVRAIRPEAVFAENVGMNDHPAPESPNIAVQGWIASPGHRENLLGGYARTGVGVARRGDGTFFYTQIYVD